MKNGKYIDVVKTEPKTEFEVHLRWANNLAAQTIGLNSRSKTIEIKEAQCQNQN